MRWLKSPLKIDLSGKILYVRGAFAESDAKVLKFDDWYKVFYHSGKSISYRQDDAQCTYSEDRTYLMSVINYISQNYHVEFQLKTFSGKNTNAYGNRLRFYSRIPLLMIDDWLCEPLKPDQVACMLELIEER